MGGKFAAVLGRRAQGGSRDAQAVSVIELLGEGLVEIDLWDRVRIGDVERWGLVEEEVVLRRAARRGEGRRAVGQLEVDEDRADYEPEAGVTSLTFFPLAPSGEGCRGGAPERTPDLIRSLTRGL